MQFKSFHWLGNDGIWAIMPCSTNVVIVCVAFWGAFKFILFLFSIILGLYFNKTIIPVALVGYELVIFHLIPCARARARWIIFNWLHKKAFLNYFIEHAIENIVANLVSAAFAQGTMGGCARKAKVYRRCKKWHGSANFLEILEISRHRLKDFKMSRHQHTASSTSFSTRQKT